MVAQKVPVSHSEMWLLWILSPACQQPSFSGSCQPPSRSRLPLLQLACSPASARSRPGRRLKNWKGDRSGEMGQVEAKVTRAWYWEQGLQMCKALQIAITLDRSSFIVFVCQLGGPPCLSRIQHWRLCAKLAEQGHRSGPMRLWSL